MKPSARLLALGAIAAAAFAPPAAAQWRVAADAGLIDAMQVQAQSVAVERRTLGPLALGARGSRIGGSGLGDDANTADGGAGELYAAIGANGGAAHLRLEAGLGASVVDYLPSGLVEFDPDEFGDGSPYGRRLRGHAYVGLGVDVYVARVVGVGVGIRVAPPFEGFNTSGASVGLRVRI